MNKAFEKILDGIESLKSNKGFGGTVQTMYADGMLDKAKQIVQEVAEEYNNGWIPCSGCKDCKNKECEHYGKV